MSKRLTNEEFISKAIVVHGNKYTYSEVEYITAIDKVLIRCPEHGLFPQSPNKHLCGRGCPKCGNIANANSKLDTTASFIVKARLIHGDRYNYSKADYKSAKELITIICRVHGEFQQMPSKHLSGHNCTKCSGRYKPTTEDFIARAIEIHGSTYKYSKALYGSDNEEKVIVTCKIHGDFLVSPANHIHKASGCPHCARERNDISKRQAISSGKPVTLYYVYIQELNLWKVGCTNKPNILDRFSRDSYTIDTLLAKTYSNSCEAYSVESFILGATRDKAITTKPLKSKGNTELRSSEISNIEILIAEAESLYKEASNKLELFEEDYHEW